MPARGQITEKINNEDFAECIACRSMISKSWHVRRREDGTRQWLCRGTDLNSHRKFRDPKINRGRDCLYGWETWPPESDRASRVSRYAGWDSRAGRTTPIAELVASSHNHEMLRVAIAPMSWAPVMAMHSLNEVSEDHPPAGQPPPGSTALVLHHPIPSTILHGDSQSSSVVPSSAPLVPSSVSMPPLLGPPFSNAMMPLSNGTLVPLSVVQGRHGIHLSNGIPGPQPAYRKTGESRAASSGSKNPNSLPRRDKVPNEDHAECMACQATSSKSWHVRTREDGSRQWLCRGTDLNSHRKFRDPKINRGRDCLYGWVNWPPERDRMPKPPVYEGAAGEAPHTEGAVGGPPHTELTASASQSIGALRTLEAPSLAAELGGAAPPQAAALTGASPPTVVSAGSHALTAADDAHEPPLGCPAEVRQDRPGPAAVGEGQSVGPRVHFTIGPPDSDAVTCRPLDEAKAQAAAKELAWAVRVRDSWELGWAEWRAAGCPSLTKKRARGAE